MSYRHRTTTTGYPLSLVLVGFGVGIVVLGLFCALIAVYLTSLTGSLAGPSNQLFGQMLVEPLVVLFQGGVVTFVVGFVFMIGGGSAVFIFA